MVVMNTGVYIEMTVPSKMDAGYINICQFLCYD